MEPEAPGLSLILHFLKQQQWASEVFIFSNAIAKKSISMEPELALNFLKQQLPAALTLFQIRCYSNKDFLSKQI